MLNSLFAITKNLDSISICSHQQASQIICKSTRAVREFHLSPSVHFVLFSDAWGHPSSLRRVCCFCAGTGQTVKIFKGACCLKDSHWRLAGHGLGVRMLGSALAGVAQWIECQPVNQRIVSSIPSQGIAGPQWGAHEEQSHSNISLPLFLPPVPSL